MVVRNRLKRDRAGRKKPTRLPKIFWKVTLYHRGAEGGGGLDKKSAELAHLTSYEDDYSNVNNTTFAFESKQVAQSFRDNIQRQNKEGSFKVQNITVVPVMALNAEDLTEKIDKERERRELAIMKRMGL